MCSKEIRCPHPCYRTLRSKLLLKVAPDATGEFETKCNKDKKCIVIYNATTKELICKPTKE